MRCSYGASSVEEWAGTCGDACMLSVSAVGRTCSNVIIVIINMKCRVMWGGNTVLLDAP